MKWFLGKKSASAVDVLAVKFFFLQNCFVERTAWDASCSVTSIYVARLQSFQLAPVKHEGSMLV
jgi:hypothetical protein